MFTFIVIAFIGGLLTIVAPCILAVLPIILGTTLGNQNKLRPIAIVLGLTVSFTGFGLLFNYFTNLFGISNNTLRNVALVFLMLFALALIFPVSYEKLLFKIMAIFSKIFPAKKISAQDLAKPPKQKGLLNGFMVGTSLGLVWVPCAGPILGTILTLAITQSDFSKVLVLLLAYSLGAGLPMLLIAYGGNFIVSKTKIFKRKGELIQRISGIILFGGVILIMTGFDTKIAVELGKLFPSLNNFEQTIVDENSREVEGTGSKEKKVLVRNDVILTPFSSQESGATVDTPQIIFSKKNIPIHLLKKGEVAPEIIGTQSWINSKPLQLADLKGKVVIVDFWTYSCINCIRTLPYITNWHKNYKDQGLVIIGVHTPEFAFEKELSNVQKAVKEFQIDYPVVQDNQYKTWNNYDNHYWPAKYIIDQEGFVRYKHFGEGQYDETETVIQTLLAEGNNRKMDFSLQTEDKPQDVVVQSKGMSETPETYLGLDRGDYYGNKQRRMINQIQTFLLPSQFTDNTFYLEGEWLIEGENIVLKKAPGKIVISYQSNKINLVAGKSEKAVKAKILLDGKPLPKDKFGKNVEADGTVIFDQATLYNLVDTGSSYEKHIVTIEFEEADVKAYAFTFG